MKYLSTYFLCGHSTLGSSPPSLPPLHFKLGFSSSTHYYLDVSYPNGTPTTMTRKKKIATGAGAKIARQIDSPQPKKPEHQQSEASPDHQSSKASPDHHLSEASLEGSPDHQEPKGSPDSQALEVSPENQAAIAFPETSNNGSTIAKISITPSTLSHGSWRGRLVDRAHQ